MKEQTPWAPFPLGAWIKCGCGNRIDIPVGEPSRIPVACQECKREI